MSILDRLFAPKEVKACHLALTELRPLLTNVLIADAVLLPADAMMPNRKNWPHMVNSVQRVGVSPRDTVLYAIVQQAKGLLAAGQFHVYRGVLGTEGASIRSVSGLTLEKLVRSGFIDVEQAAEQRAELGDIVKEWG